MTLVDFHTTKTHSHDSDIDRCVQTAVYQQTCSGAAAIGLKEHHIFHEGYYGFCSSDKSPRVDENTFFDLSSLTKPLATGLLAMHWGSRGRLDLQSELSLVFQELKGSPAGSITLDMLLDHTAGFAATLDIWQVLYDEDRNLPENQRLLGRALAKARAQRVVLDSRLKFTPGTQVLYSDVNFLVLGWVLEQVGGKPLHELVRRELFEPLGIADDVMFLPHDEALKVRSKKIIRHVAATENCPRRAKLLCAEVHDINAWALGGVAGHAGLFATARGVARLVQRLFHTFSGGDDDVLLPAAVRRFWTRSKRVTHSTRTLGWDTPTVRQSSAGVRMSRNAVGHLGYSGTSVWLDLSSGVLGVLLTNAVHPDDTHEHRERLQHLRPKFYDAVAKVGESFAAQDDEGKGQGSQGGFGFGGGAGFAIGSPLRGPGK